MPRILIVSNRLPVTVSKIKGQIALRESSGGLATGLASLSASSDRLWIGWPGIPSDKLTDKEKAFVTAELAKRKCLPVFLSTEDIEDYYYGFSNKTLWPLFHYFAQYAQYETAHWQAYDRVNHAFEAAVRSAAHRNDLIWIHDYHLMLLPRLLREQAPDAEIGFFLHIPFPSFEIFRLLPWRYELLSGLLGADLIGFHTYSYANHFLTTVSRIAGFDHTLGRITTGDRLVKADVFPMGIDYAKFAGAGELPRVRRELARLRKTAGQFRVILSVDRLDYTKGILQRLEAFDAFLTEHPEHRGRVTLILLAVPSRTQVSDYAELRDRLERTVSRINGEHATVAWTPVRYLYRDLPFEPLAALYRLADVALVTPLRDGMNLIAKEYVASRADGRGVLILSEMAGAASELGEALVVNPNDKAAIVRALARALEMPAEEQTHRLQNMQQRLSRYTVARWADEFLGSLAEMKRESERLATNRVTEALARQLVKDYRSTHRRLLLLDYDGTLVGFAATPPEARPDDALLGILQRLARDSANEVVIISGRDHVTLDKWLGPLHASLVAEHGAWSRGYGGDWKPTEPVQNDWKAGIRPVLELYADRTPGTFVEEKDFSLVWHCRRAEPELARRRTEELKDALSGLTERLDVGVFVGHKTLEVKRASVNKGRVTRSWLERRRWDFILALGDDYTDEDMFAVLPDWAWSIRVGPDISKARFHVESVAAVRALLTRLTRR